MCAWGERGSWHACGSQRTTCGRGFSPSTMWVLGIKPRSSVLASLPTKPSHQPPSSSSSLFFLLALPFSLSF